MRKGTAFALVGATLVGGYFVGRQFRHGDEDAPKAGASAGAGAAQVERKRIPLSGEAKGPVDAMVNIVEFSDFQCPYCSRVVPNIARLMKEYPARVRVFF